MNSKMEKLIQLTGEKLGIPAEKLKKSLEKGNLEDMLGSMRKEDAARLKAIMDNPAAKEKLMKTAEAEEIAKKIQGK
ncbi:MAG: hypothetical protein NC203_04410 [Firmicutes bacterium]|nr:hypothetical protein [Bacillota bacterium]